MDKPVGRISARNLRGGAESLSPVSTGQLNRYIGWILLVTGFVCAAWFGVGSFGWGDMPAPANDPRSASLLGMAVLQLAAAQILSRPARIVWIRPTAEWLIGSGAAVYALGTILAVRSTGGGWLIAAGALVNLTGFMLLAGTASKWACARDLRMILFTFAFGAVLLAVVELIVASPSLLLAAPLGPEDGIRLRMLRLARAAGVTLPALTLLHHGLAVRADPHSRAVRWGRIGMLGGTILMAGTLTAAGVTSPGLRYLLPIPAIAIFVGAAAGVCLARRHARPLEFWGWLLISLSMAGGLLIGIVAFDGPISPPDFIGGYTDFVRRFLRQEHIHAIILGVASVFISRGLGGRNLE